MRTPASGLGGVDSLNEPLLVLQLSWDAADTDHTYLTSNDIAQLPVLSPVVDSIDNVVMNISGQTQRINPDIATSTIGSVIAQLLDLTLFENLITYSEQLDNAAWTNDGSGGVTVTPDFAKAPNNTFTADRCVYVNGGLGRLWQAFGSEYAGSTVTLSIWLKSNTGIDQTIEIFVREVGFGTIYGAGSFTVTGEWNRFSVTAAIGALSSGFMTLCGYHSNAPDPTWDILQWGVQLTETAHAINYSRTEASARTADVPALTDKMATRLAAGDGLRGKIARVYVGYRGLPFSSYDLRLTYIIDSVSYRDGQYKLTLSDIQREERKKLFTPDETNLSATISADDLIIPVTSSDTTKFQLVERGSEAANFPGQTISYLKIEDEAIAINSQVQFDTTNGWHINAIQRGALATRAVEHKVDGGAQDSRKPVVKEHVFLEGAAPKIIYALLTGVLLNGSSPEAALPEHWHLGINTTFVRLADFQALGDDYWDITNNAGRRVRIENPGTQDGKKFIETEMLVWLGAFMPIYSTGELGIKRLTRVLSDSAYQAQLDHGNVKSYTDMVHDYRSVINDIRVHWNYIDSLGEFTKESLFIDATSIAKHGKADSKEFEFNTVHTGAHTDENLFAYFDTLRDRYSGPPLMMSLSVMPSMHLLEVGDTVRVKLDQVRDFNTGLTLDRTFEIQQINTNWTTGALDLKLFASSQAAGELDRTTLPSVLEDGFYIAEGTSLDSSDSPSGPLTIVAGVVTVSGTVNGNADMNNAAAIYFYDGDLTINAGVTVTINANVQLRIKGTLTVNGAIDGLGQGPAGGAATTLLENAATNDTWQYDASFNLTDALEAQDVDLGADGYFGVVRSGAGFNLYGFNQGQPPAYGASTFVTPVTAPGGLTARGLIIDDRRPTKGSITTLPWFDLRNPNGWSLLGIPGDLRGHGGPGGLATTTQNNDTGIGFGGGTLFIRGNGGAGGVGGAGLAIICRGMAFGGSGEIDLSGDTAGNPTAYTIGAAKTFYGGHGAPGSPGALLVMIDGNYTNPDINGENFIANMGDVGTASGATDISQADYLAAPVTPNNFSVSVVNWPYTSAVFNVDAYGANQDTAMSASAHRLQYLPEPEQPADDFGPGVLERGKFNELLFFQKTAVPVASQFYGYGSAVMADGSRFAVADLDSPNTINFVRNVKNPEREQSLATDSGEGLILMYFDLLGDRLLAWAPTGGGGAGRVHVYSRAIKTWSLEQAFTYGSGAGGATAQFGRSMGWDKTGTHMLTVNVGIAVTAAGAQIEYWSRSGTTWSYIESLPVPASVSTTYSSGVAISGDGLWAITADALLGGGTPHGAIHLYERTTNSPMWELRDTLTVPGYDDDAANLIPYQFGFDGLSHVNAVHMNYEGTGIAVAGFYDSTRWIHSVERQGTKLKHIAKLRTDSNSLPTTHIISISDNGLILAAQSSDGLGFIVIYRRNNISEGFKYDHQVTNNDGASYTGSERAQMAGTGQFIILGNVASDVGANNSGHVEIWEYYPEAD